MKPTSPEWEDGPGSRIRFGSQPRLHPAEQPHNAAANCCAVAILTFMVLAAGAGLVRTILRALEL